jgi:hypothetical protein
MTVVTEGFVDLKFIPPVTPVTVTDVFVESAMVRAVAVDVEEVMVEYFTEPNVRAVISARVLPAAETLMSIGEFVTSTVISPAVQPKIVHANTQSAEHDFITAFRIPSSRLIKVILF